MSSKEISKFAYRPYIDGLRGVAVSAVVLYHTKLLGVTGGFVGVDVFFVISGFLITAIILRDLKKGTFSLLDFWERRIRRIFPVMFAVILATIVAAYFLILFPADYLRFGNTVIAQSTFTSNMLFMVTDNYFDQPAISSPLLHTWSLSLEEQFYVLFPFLLITAIYLAKLPIWSTLWTRIRGYVPSRRGMFAVFNEGRPKQEVWVGHRVVVLLALVFGVASFLLNVWLVNTTPNASFAVPPLPERFFWGTTHATAGFYLLPARVWELVAGILIALGIFRVKSVLAAEVLGVAGLSLVGVSLFSFHDGTAFPGIAALLPVLGAMAIIIANENHQTWSGKVLASRVLVGVGLISYSLYLWHWPVLIFGKMLVGSWPSKLVISGLIGVMFLLSILSYLYIERPFRKKEMLPEQRNVFLFGFSVMVLFVLSGSLIVRNATAFSTRIPDAAKQILMKTGEGITWGGSCFRIKGVDSSRYDKVCRIGAREPLLEKQFVVWGDSHADALVPLFSELGRRKGVQGVVFDEGHCVPIIGVHQIPVAPLCEEEKEYALRYIEENNIREVFLVARWSEYVIGGRDNRPRSLITDSNSHSQSPGQATEVFRRNFLPMIQRLSRDGRRVYIVKQTPEQFDFDAKEAFYRAAKTKKEFDFIGVTTESHREFQILPNAVIDSLSGVPGVIIIDPSLEFCEDGGYCRLEGDGKFIYRDASHLSTFGAMQLESTFRSAFDHIGLPE